MAEFKLPEVGEGITSGVVVSILVSVGDTVEKDQPVLELETDKAVVEVPSDVSGTVESINVEENEEAEVGQVILTLGDGDGAAEESEDDSADEDGGGEDEAKADAADESADDAESETTDEDTEEVEAKTSDGEDSDSEGSDTKSSDTKDKSDTEAKADKDAKSKKADGEDAEADDVDRDEQYTPAPDSSEDAGDRKLIPAAPSVRRLAREMGINLQEVQGSGIMGRISAEDLRRYQEGDETPAQKAPAAPAQQEAPSLPDFSKWGETERVSMSGIRKATVRSMTQAWTSVPMVTQFDKADITEFEVLRKRYQPKAEAVGAKLTPTAMLLKVVAGALRKFPDFNASIDTVSNEVVYKKYVNLGVAVDTEKGLLVPVIKDADRKNMVELAQELGELAEKARDRKLSPDQMQGGNFNVSNLGGIGGTGFTPIVNPPDVAILGVSRGGMEPVWNKLTETFEPRMMMPLSVTYDHRLIDGAQAARFLRWVCTAIEDPFLLALEG